MPDFRQSPLYKETTMVGAGALAVSTIFGAFFSRLLNRFRNPNHLYRHTIPITLLLFATEVTGLAAWILSEYKSFDIAFSEVYKEEEKSEFLEKSKNVPIYTPPSLTGPKQ